MQPNAAAARYSFAGQFSYANNDAPGAVGDRTAETKRVLASLRREVTTQEVLDIVAGARHVRNR